MPAASARHATALMFMRSPEPSRTRVDQGSKVKNFILLRRDDPLAVHERPQRVGNHNRAILLLIVFEDGDERPANRETRSIERVHEIGLAAVGSTELDAGATCLERLRI